MTDITQTDRDAALHLAMRAGTGLHPKDVKEVLEGRHDKNAIVQAFARHREQVEQDPVAKIVAWLRSGAMFAATDIEIATAIEAGVWK